MGVTLVFDSYEGTVSQEGRQVNFELYWSKYLIFGDIMVSIENIIINV